MSKDTFSYPRLLQALSLNTGTGVGAATASLDYTPVRMDWLSHHGEPRWQGWTSSHAGGPPWSPHLYRGRRHLPSLVEVQRDDLGEAGGVTVHAGAAIAKSLQDGVESLPLLHCGKRSGAVQELCGGHGDRAGQAGAAAPSHCSSPQERSKGTGVTQ